MGRESVQRSPHEAAHDPAAVPPVVRAELSSPGQALDAATQSGMEMRLGHSLHGVRLHTGERAAESAEAIGARAYTFGQHVVFGRGAYAPHAPLGQRLLAHELTHVLQQGGLTATPNLNEARLAGPELEGAERQAERVGQAAVTAPGMALSSPVAAGGVQRKTLGTKFTHPAGAKSPHKKITATFDGAQFTVLGDGKQIMQIAAQSGRPYTVRPGDAAACGGSKDDSYLNNPRYVGISDNGPIPEGTYRFTATQMATFTQSERLQMLPGGSFTDPFGVSLHGGDWGAGRVPLAPVSIVPGPKGCGNTKTRSGFFLHGGIMPGSSGCIDIGNAGVDNLVSLLGGYTGPITVTVKYTAKAPEVGPVDRAVGRFTYPQKKDPGIWDRIKAAAGAE